MPRFYFDFRQGGALQADDIGIEFPSAERAYLGAMEAIRGMWGELLAKRQDPRRCLFEVRGQKGELLFAIPFNEILDTCTDGKEPLPLSGLEKSLQDAHAIHAQALKGREALHSELLKARRALLESAALIAQPF